MKKNIKVSIWGIILVAFSFIIDNKLANLISDMQLSLLITIFKIITMIGNIEVILPILIVISIIFYYRKKKLSGIWLSTICTLIISSVMKLLINRPRPFEAIQIDSWINTSLSSFPSGHSMIMFSILPFLVKNYNSYKTYFWIIAILVALSRIILNVHYLSDVIAGAFIGYIIGSILSTIEDNYSWK